MNQLELTPTLSEWTFESFSLTYFLRNTLQRSFPKFWLQVIRLIKDMIHMNHFCKLRHSQNKISENSFLKNGILEFWSEAVLVEIMKLKFLLFCVELEFCALRRRPWLGLFWSRFAQLLTSPRRPFGRLLEKLEARNISAF